MAFKADRIVEITRPYWFGRLIGEGQTIGSRVDASNHLWLRRMDDANGIALYQSNVDTHTTIPRAVFCCAFEPNTARSKSGLRPVDPFVVDEDSVIGRAGDVLTFNCFGGFYEGDGDGPLMRCRVTVADNFAIVDQTDTNRAFRDAFVRAEENSFVYDAYGGNVTVSGQNVRGNGDPVQQAWIVVKDLEIVSGAPRAAVRDNVVRRYEISSRSSFYRAEVGVVVGETWAERESLSFATRFRSESFRPGDTAIYRIRMSETFAGIVDWSGFYLRDPLAAGFARYTVEGTNVLGRNRFLELLCHGAEV